MGILYYHISAGKSLSGPVSDVAVAASAQARGGVEHGERGDTGGVSSSQRLDALEEMVFSLEQRLKALEDAAELKLTDRE